MSNKKEEENIKTPIAKFHKIEHRDPNRPRRHKKHPEDSFELDKFQREHRRNVAAKKRRRTKKTVRALNIEIAIVSIGLIVVALLFYFSYSRKVNNENISSETKDVIEVVTTETEDIDDNADENNVEADKEVDQAIEEEIHEEIEDEIVEVVPEIQEPVEPEELQEILDLQEAFNNTDIIAYLEIENTNIVYPVVQSDDNTFYLENDVNKEENAAGSIFMDYENNIYPLDKNTVIYGHNMKDGTYFHNLRFYIDSQFYRSNKYIKLVTLNEVTTWEIFSFYETNTDFQYTNTVFSSDEVYSSFLQEIVNRSLYQMDTTVSFEDKILTLSTCTNESDDTRYVLTAKLITNN